MRRLEGEGVGALQVRHHRLHQLPDESIKILVVHLFPDIVTLSNNELPSKIECYSFFESNLDMTGNIIS